MPHSTMRTAVLQATAIYLFSQILHHHTSSGMFDGFTEDEGVRNFTAVMNRTSSMVAASASATPVQTTRDGHNITNQTLSHSNSTQISYEQTDALDPWFNEAFYSWSLLRGTISRMLVSMLQYYWLIWLERILPARQKRRDAYHLRAGENDDREEEIVKKWMSQGRIKRASLNWCNTFLKWVLDLTIGRFLYHSIELVIKLCLGLKSPKLIMKTLTTHLALSFFSEILSIVPLATLVAFIVIPAHSQLVFVAAAELVSSLFVLTLIRILATWVVKTDFAQVVLRNMTNAADKQLRAGRSLDSPWVFSDEL